ncbi:MAG: tripartite tricarboxylate transporter substrate binding protein [Actinomycetota bacterium]|nr:tripartite tricarboxylate transporter substrate binding protein [Actinomycetota bacterium]
MKTLRTVVGLSVGLVLAACGGGSDTAGGPAAQPEYPTERIRLIVPYTAGGPTDIAARTIAQYMEKDLGETVLVENKPGASGATAYQELIAAKPDGYTLSMFALPTAVLNYLTNDVGYTKESFVPVGSVTRVPSAIVVPANSPHKSVDDLFAFAKANPGKVTVGTPGATNTHAAETRRITNEYGIPLTVVPFNGNSEVQTALLGGNVVAGFLNVSQDMLPAIESGKLRALAVGSADKLDYVDAPTLVQEGYPELTQSTTTFGVVAPKGTPDDVIATLEATMRDALQEPTVVAKLDKRYVDDFLGRRDLEALFADIEETFKDVPKG